MFPIFIPSSHRPVPPRCPNCSRLEDIENRCRHCHYVYPEAEGIPTWLGGLFVMLGVGGIMWAMLTFLMWAMPFDGQPTLVQVVSGQFAWVWALLHRVW